MKTDSYDALRVKADKHNVFAAELVAEVAKDDTTQHDSAEVGRGNERTNELAVADQAPLEKIHWLARIMHVFP